MNITKRRRRTAKKLFLPLVALGMMTTATYLGSINRSHTSTRLPAAVQVAPAPSAGTAARVPHDLRQR